MKNDWHIRNVSDDTKMRVRLRAAELNVSIGAALEDLLNRGWDTLPPAVRLYRNSFEEKLRIEIEGES